MSPKPFDSRQLLAFATLARTGSFTETAKQLFLTQSAISHSIKALEQDLGCELFHRLGKNIHLTAAGRTLVQTADLVLRQMTEAREILGRENEWGGGQLRIAAGPTACQYILPSALREFKETFPRCQVVLEANDTPEALEDLQANRADLAFVLEPRTTVEHAFYPLFTDELAYIVAPSHPWVSQGRATRAEIPEQSLILYSRSSYTYRLMSRFFREEGLDFQSSFELKSVQAIKEMVKISMGIAMLAPWVAEEEIRQGLLVAIPLGRRKIKRTWGVAFLKRRKLSLAEETFLGLCETVCRNMGAQHGGITAHRPTKRI